MRLKLCRHGNVFNSKFYITLILLFVASLIPLAIQPAKFKIILLAIASVVLIYFVVFPLNFPKHLELKDGIIKYTTPITFPTPGGGGFKCVKTHYTVSNITHIELQQNAIERFLGIAHLSFSGTNEIHAKKHLSNLPDIKTHCIYGIVLKEHQSFIEDFIATCQTQV